MTFWKAVRCIPFPVLTETNYSRDAGAALVPYLKLVHGRELLKAMSEHAVTATGDRGLPVQANDRMSIMSLFPKRNRCARNVGS